MIRNLVIFGFSRTIQSFALTEQGFTCDVAKWGDILEKVDCKKDQSTNEQDCLSTSNCCWEESGVNGVPWCYVAKPDITVDFEDIFSGEDVINNNPTSNTTDSVTEGTTLVPTEIVPTEIVPTEVISTELICAAGSYSFNSTCKLCPGGFSCDSTVNSEPVVCPVGTFCPPGSVSPISCPDGFFCPEKSWRPFDCPRGSYCVNGIRETCDSGYYNLVSKQTECLPCEGGKYCPNPAMAPKTCPSGNYCLPLSIEPEICPVGYWCPEETFRPFDCPIGGICDEEGLSEPKFEEETTTVSSTTTSTTTTSTTTTEIMTTEMTTPEVTTETLPEIITCPIGQHRTIRGRCSPCPAGTAGVSSGLCVECPEGTFQPRTGSKTCRPCPAGHFCAYQSLTRPEKCPQNSIASNLAQTECKLCPGNSVSNEDATNCQVCPSGYFKSNSLNNEISEKFEDRLGGCFPCESGEFCKKGYRNKCPRGSYQNKAVQGECLACPRGYFCKTGSKAPLACSKTISKMDKHPMPIECKNFFKNTHNGLGLILHFVV